MKIPVFCSYMRRKDMDSVLNCMVTDFLGPGQFLKELQKLASDLLVCDFCFAVRSPWIALDQCLQALSIQQGDCVALPILAPSYYKDVLEGRGIVPLYFDCKKDSIEWDFSFLLECQSRPKALLLYEALGIMSDPQEVAELGLPIIEDISHSFGAKWGERKAGSLGHYSFWGLESGSLITAGGGAIVFSNKKKESQNLRTKYDRLPAELKLTDVNAALGLAQLKNLDAIEASRREALAKFLPTLHKNRHAFISQREGEGALWAFPLYITSGMQEVRDYAEKHATETELAFGQSILSFHLENSLLPDSLSYPNSKAMLLRCLLFPLHQRIGTKGLEIIEKLLSTLP